MAQVMLADGRLVDMPDVFLKDYKPKVTKVFKRPTTSYLRSYYLNNVQAAHCLKFHRKFEKEKQKVKPMVEKIAQKLNLDEYASEALLETVATMRSASCAKDKLAAAKLVLDFTMAKPASKQDIKVSSAEDWLKSIVSD
jgi:hypothetical protein